MSEEQHVALPKLYGAPAYARPPRLVEASGRPFDEDDLPLEVFRSDEDLALLADFAQPAAQPAPPPPPSSSGGLLPRIFDLRSLTRSR
jgi:hypothetical protein